jgi:hypothetical protein
MCGLPAGRLHPGVYAGQYLKYQFVPATASPLIAPERRSPDLPRPGPTGFPGSDAAAWRPEIKNWEDHFP